MSDIKEKFQQLQQTDSSSWLGNIREKAYQQYSELGIPTMRHEEYKYTRVTGLFNKDYGVAPKGTVQSSDIDSLRLPGHENANELVFVNGIYNAGLSTVKSKGLTVLSLEDAANDYKDIVTKHFNHSAQYLNDGVNALNTAMVNGGIYIHTAAGTVVEHPVYIYNVNDAREVPVFAQPRSLVYVNERVELSIVETYLTLGNSDTLTNQVIEMVVEKDAILNYYKIQNDKNTASQVNTTQIHQVGKSVANSVTITLDGAIVRNNLHAVMEASHAESHLYGLYLTNGKTHVDNHSIVDNVVPDCQSNELYKGVLSGESTGVFNGKIFVRKDAQKTNAFQSNKNILLSEDASVNTKPQLEIYADDVKCSHGCTVGSIDVDGLFYLRSRGVPEQTAIALLLQGFALDILEMIKLAPIRNYVEQLIEERLSVK
jgi:Fe-S cluster assembly protein SufD